MSNSQKPKHGAKGKGAISDDPERVARIKQLNQSLKATLDDEGSLIAVAPSDEEDGGNFPPNPEQEGDSSSVTASADEEEEDGFRDGTIEDAPDDDVEDFDGPDDVDQQVRAAFSKSGSAANHSKTPASKRSYAPLAGAGSAAPKRRKSENPEKKHARFESAAGDDSEEEEQDADDCEHDGYDSDELELLRQMVSKKAAKVRKEQPRERPQHFMRREEKQGKDSPKAAKQRPERK